MPTLTAEGCSALRVSGTTCPKCTTNNTSTAYRECTRTTRGRSWVCAHLRGVSIVGNVVVLDCGYPDVVRTHPGNGLGLAAPT